MTDECIFIGWMAHVLAVIGWMAHILAAIGWMAQISVVIGWMDHELVVIGWIGSEGLVVGWWRVDPDPFSWRWLNQSLKYNLKVTFVWWAQPKGLEIYCLENNQLGSDHGIPPPKKNGYQGTIYGQK